MNPNTPPCAHDAEWTGTVSAGSNESGPYCSVVTCEACIIASQGYVQMVAGLPANPFVSYEEHRESETSEPN